jgi:hypothetical protein
MATSEKNIVVLHSATCYHNSVRRKPLPSLIGSVADTSDDEARTTQEYLNVSLVASIATKGQLFNC